MAATLTDFSDLEKHIIQSSVDERWGKGKVVAEEVEVELRLAKGDRELTLCPAMYWQHGDCHFLISKVDGQSGIDGGRYRSQFFYSPQQQFNTGIEEYTDLVECALSLLRLQADHESERTQAFPR